MSAGSAFQARGPATDSAWSPILVRVRGMSKVRLLSEQRCDRPDVADVNVIINSQLKVKKSPYVGHSLSISTKFGTVKQFNPLDRLDRYKFKI